MAKMPDECVDLAVVDPPFDLGYWEWVEGWLETIKRLLKPAASIYVFCGIGEKSDSLSRILPIVKELFVFKNLITWKKQQGYGTQRNWMYVREEIVFAVNGPNHIFHPQYTKEIRHKYGFRVDSGELARNYSKSIYKRASNVWTDIKQLSGPFKKTEWLDVCVAQKPEALIERIISASSDKDGLVFDPFMGTGTTAVAALKLGRHFYGCDINPEYVKLANERVEKARLEMAQMELFSEA